MGHLDFPIINSTQGQSHEHLRRATFTTVLYEDNRLAN